MCMDFMDLNKAYPKNAYPLSSIDKLVDRASEVEFLSFMDFCFGYNQIRMHLIDEEKMVFIIENANYCYKVIAIRIEECRS